MQAARLITDGRNASLLAVLLALAVAALVPSTAAAQAPSFGVHSQAISDFEADRMERGGVRSTRMTFKWSRVQPVEDGPYDWTFYDRLMARTASHGIDVLPIIIGSPDYAAPLGSQQPTSKEDKRRFETFVTALVARYGNNGSFWRANPSRPAVPVRAWQVWNEPNLRNFWLPRPRPRSYVRFLDSTRDAIRRADPNAAIVLAGMPETKRSLPMSEFLSRMYRVKGFKRLVDAVAVHSYSPDAQGVVAVAEKQRRVMRKAGDSRTPIWITELGWGSDGPAGHPLVKTEAVQASLLKQSFGLLRANAERLSLQRVYWYDFRDLNVAPGTPDAFFHHTGLFERDRSPKPAWAAFTGFVGGSPGSGAIPPNTTDLGLNGLLEDLP